ncbi:MAG: class I SAM-dependent methyltransferase [Chloroflexota bacterium]|nr:class I SAM-dependent methyltransferase [Chloroflexota bacterium]
MGEQDKTSREQPLLYTHLADWYHLLTAPAEYDEEARFFLRLITTALGGPARSLLELGSGGGNMASHYKRELAQVTLTDLSPHMLALSERINPECEHVQGDMRDLRLGRAFDAVFVHDAVGYLTNQADLRQAMQTAFVHCRPGGVSIFAPDHVRENFADSVEADGHDDAQRGLRYLMWTWDPDPADETYIVDFAYLLREQGKPMRCVYDRHVEGLFDRATWLRLLEEVGFAHVQVRPLEHPDVPLGSVDVFVAVKPVC